MSGTGYEGLTQAIKDAPLTWLPALLILIVQESVKRRVYQPGGLQKVVDRATEEAAR